MFVNPHDFWPRHFGLAFDRSTHGLLHSVRLQNLAEARVTYSMWRLRLPRITVQVLCILLGKALTMLKHYVCWHLSHRTPVSTSSRDVAARGLGFLRRGTVAIVFSLPLKDSRAGWILMNFHLHVVAQQDTT